MKTLYIIGGTMGIGKTAVCRELNKQLPNSVFLDGDWCWDADPFQVTEETKAMVLDNICYLLNSFLRCSAYENVVFCWVLHEKVIWDTILSRLNTGTCSVKRISLTAQEDALRQRLEKDIARGLRQPDIIDRSIARLPAYLLLDTLVMDTTHLTIRETAETIRNL